MTDIFDESVFALSFKRNLTVSLNVRIRRQHHHLYSLACIQHSTIRVWGLFLAYLRSGFVRTSFEITKNGSTLSLLIP